MVSVPASLLFTIRPALIRNFIEAVLAARPEGVLL